MSKAIYEPGQRQAALPAAIRPVMATPRLTGWVEGAGVGRSAQALVRSVLMRLMDFSLLASDTLEAVFPNAELFAVRPTSSGYALDNLAAFIPAEALIGLEEDYWDAYTERDAYVGSYPITSADTSLVSQVTHYSSRRTLEPR